MITGTDAFWDSSVPNPMVGSLNNPTSSLSSIRPEATQSGSLNPVPGQSMGINLPSTRPPIVNRKPRI
jgi:hypothetical protein